jgi:SAM-dependent methyltransferase
MFDAIVAGLVDDAAVLEIGGGIGAISVELLKAGARSAVNVELSRSYRDAAVALALEAEVQDRLHLVAGDGADVATDMGPFDIVVMNRVVCCYPNARRLMETAAHVAGRTLAVSYPTAHLAARAVVGAGNWLRARRGSDFRTFVHPSITLLTPVMPSFVEILRRRRLVWSVHVWERSDAPVVPGGGGSVGF